MKLSPNLNNYISKIFESKILNPKLIYSAEGEKDFQVLFFANEVKGVVIAVFNSLACFLSMYDVSKSKWIFF